MLLVIFSVDSCARLNGAIEKYKVCEQSDRFFWTVWLFLYFLGLFPRSWQEIEEKCGRLKGELSGGLENRLVVQSCVVVSYPPVLVG